MGIFGLSSNMAADVLIGGRYRDGTVNGRCCVPGYVSSTRNFQFPKFDKRPKDSYKGRLDECK